jgi:starvation-inducible DNA-binding protein
MNEKLNKRLSKHVSDLAALFVKLHDYHWHVRGSQFKVIHEMTEAYYDEVNEQLDAVAERLVQLGGTAPASLKAYAAASSIADAGKTSYTADEVLSGVIADFEYLLGEFKATRKEAADTDDAATDALFADYIAGLEKKLWMLKATKG